MNGDDDYAAALEAAMLDALNCTGAVEAAMLDALNCGTGVVVVVTPGDGVYRMRHVPREELMLPEHAVALEERDVTDFYEVSGGWQPMPEQQGEYIDGVLEAAARRLSKRGKTAQWKQERQRYGRRSR